MTSDKGEAKPRYITELDLETARRHIEFNIHAHTLDIWILRDAEWSFLKAYDAIKAERDQLIEAQKEMFLNKSDAWMELLKERDKLREENGRLMEVLRKAVLWAECISSKLPNREEINFTYLNIAREALKERE